VHAHVLLNVLCRELAERLGPVEARIVHEHVNAPRAQIVTGTPDRIEVAEVKLHSAVRGTIARDAE